MNAHYTYFLILGLSVAGPFALSFDKKVAFYKKWKFVFPSMIIPAIFFIAWDILFTRNGVWSFNEYYITGLKIYNIPVEEALFFFIVPYCCIFIYECIRSYLPRIKTNASGIIILKIIVVILLITACYFNDKAYTFYTAIFNAIFISVLFLFRDIFKTFNANAFLLSYCIILLPFMAVNGFLTSLPVVTYNDKENLALRIFTIPAEDIFYGMLLIMMNIVIYEKLKVSVSAPPPSPGI